MHYVLIEYFNSFTTNKTKHHDTKHFCGCCLQCFSISKIVENHINIYLAINHTKTVALCENTYVRLQDDQKDH